MWVTMVWVDSGSLKVMGEVSFRFDIVGIEFGDVAMGRMPSRVLIFPNYSIAHRRDYFLDLQMVASPRLLSKNQNLIRMRAETENYKRYEGIASSNSE